MIPVSPINGQVYVSPGGTVYRYVAVDNKWVIVLCVCATEPTTAGDPFSSVFRQDITILRTAVGAYTSGIWADGQMTSSVVKASIQPITPEEMQLVPENRRLEAKYTLYTSTEMHAANQDAGRNADIVMIRDRQFEVLGCDYWRNNILNHYRAVVGYQS
jgi:hypothetical protein